MRISDWSSDVCSSDLPCPLLPEARIHIAGAINSPPRVRNRLAKPLVPGAVGRSSACHAHMPGNGHAFGVGADLELVRLWLSPQGGVEHRNTSLRPARTNGGLQVHMIPIAPTQATKQVG